jgi:hypothetical protein
VKQYYQDYFTDKSWQMAVDLNRKIKFILIGGWAVYLYTKALKSKDIDMIADYETLDKLRLDKLKPEYGIVKNERLHKYETVRENIHIDIYLPFYSHLAIPVEDLLKHSYKSAGFTLLQKEFLLVTKQRAYSNRKGTVKGKKDLIDIIALSKLPDFDFNLYKRISGEYKIGRYLKDLKNIYSETEEVKELNLNPHFFSKLKKEILGKLK